METFRTEEQCYTYLAKIRGKVCCARCGRDMSKLSRRREYQCKNYKCQYQQSLTVGTIFHRSSTPLTKWFLAMYLLITNKNGVSACYIKREIGVGYKTAFRMLKRIRKLMEEKSRLLEGINEIDETYYGGTQRGKKWRGRRNRGTGHKMMVMGVINRDTGTVCAEVGEKPTEAILTEFLFRNVKKESTIYSDEHRSYHNLKLCYDHLSVNHSNYERAIGSAHTNTIENFWGSLKRTIKGTYHWVSNHLLTLYVKEQAFRYNHRKSASLFDVLLHKVYENTCFI